MKSQSVFKTILCCISVIAFPLSHAIYRNHFARCSSSSSSSSIRSDGSTPWCPGLMDLAPSLFFTVAFIAARYIFAWLTADIGKHLIPRGKSSQRVYDAKITRFSHHFFEFLYFAFVTFCAYFVLQRELFFPKEFGGPGIIITQTSSNSIYQSSLSQSDGMSSQTIQFITTYFFMSAGFHIASVYFLLVESQFTDFWESCVQVVLALQLIMFGYMARHLAVGAFLMFIHDACDILTSGCKALVDSTYKITTFIGAVVLMTLWAYVRLFCLAKLVLIPMLYDIEVNHPYLQGDYESILFAILLLCLFFMNIYWFSLMAKSCFIFVVSGRVTDTHAPELTESSTDAPSHHKHSD